MKYVITANMARSLCRKNSKQEVCGLQEPAQVIIVWRGDIRMAENRIYHSVTVVIMWGDETFR